MVNFCVIENGGGYHDVLDEFVALYNEGVLNLEIQRRLGLNHNTFHKCLHRAIKDGRVDYKRKDLRADKREWKPRYYGRMDFKDNFYIRKNNKYYGCIKGEERAKLFVEKMKECDWDKSQANRIKKEVYDAKPIRRRIKSI